MVICFVIVALVNNLLVIEACVLKRIKEG